MDSSSHLDFTHIPYDLMSELFLMNLYDKPLNTKILSSLQFNNLSFELLLFYLMFFIAYLNIDAITGILPSKIKYIKFLYKKTQKIDLNLTLYLNLIFQSYISYKEDNEFLNLFGMINNITHPILIHKTYLNFLLYLNNFIITNNSITSSIKTDANIKKFKRIIRDIFDRLINYTYESDETGFNDYIVIDTDVLAYLKKKLLEVNVMLQRLGIKSPMQCIEQTKCTDLMTIETYLPQHIKHLKNNLAKKNIRLGGCSTCGKGGKKNKK